MVGYKQPYPMGGTDPDPEPRNEITVKPMEEVTFKCKDCGWTGKYDDLIPVYIPDPKCPDEVTPEHGCPSCKGNNIESD